MPDTADSEDLFIKRLKARDERAFNELVEVYGGRVYGLIYRMLGRRDEAEDMAQDVFVQVFKKIDQFRGDSKLATWVFRIAVNLCKNRTIYLARRHEAAQTELEPVAARAALTQAKGVTQGELERPDHLAEGYQVERIVQRCLGELHPEFREVLILKDVENLSYDEIAEITGLPEGTVKSRIHRARAALKASVERELGDAIP